MADMSQKAAYAMLKKALAKTKLPTSKGEKRQASADEFMLMMPEPHQGHWQFKHAGTRNYVFVNARSGKLVVPQTNKPFMRGEFDEGTQWDFATTLPMLEQIREELAGELDEGKDLPLRELEAKASRVMDQLAQWYHYGKKDPKLLANAKAAAKDLPRLAQEIVKGIEKL